MLISYLIDTEDRDGFVERYEPMNLGFKIVDSEDETEFCYEIYNTDLSGKEHKIHPYKRGPLTEAEKEVFCDILEDALNIEEKFICLFDIFESVNEFFRRKLESPEHDEIECPHCGEKNGN